jgi:hypothetical protein
MEVLVFSLWFSEVYIHTCYIDHTHEYALNDTSHRSLVYTLFTIELLNIDLPSNAKYDHPQNTSLTYISGL